MGACYQPTTGGEKLGEVQIIRFWKDLGRCYNETPTRRQNEYMGRMGWETVSRKCVFRENEGGNGKKKFEGLWNEKKNESSQNLHAAHLGVSIIYVLARMPLFLL